MYSHFEMRPNESKETTLPCCYSDQEALNNCSGISNLFLICTQEEHDKYSVFLPFARAVCLDIFEKVSCLFCFVVLLLATGYEIVFYLDLFITFISAWCLFLLSISNKLFRHLTSDFLAFKHATCSTNFT